MCFWISWPNSSMGVDQGDSFSKAPDWKPLFLLKMKSKQNLAYPNKKHNEIFKYIHEDSGSIPEIKKSALTNGWENKIAHWEPSKAISRWISAVCSQCSCALCGVVKPPTKCTKKILQFLFSFKLVKFKLLYKYEHFFFLKTGNLIKN